MVVIHVSIPLKEICKCLSHEWLIISPFVGVRSIFHVSHVGFVGTDVNAAE